MSNAARCKRIVIKLLIILDFSCIDLINSYIGAVIA